MRKLFWRVSLLVVTVIIIYLSVVPTAPSEGLGWDKLNHLVAMGVVTILAYLSINYAAYKTLVYSSLYSMVLGLFIEFIQGACTTTRSAEWQDLVADFIGTVTAVLFLFLKKQIELRKGNVS